MANLKNTEIDDTGFLRLPRGNNSDRPSNPQDGEIRYNTQSKIIEQYDTEYNAWYPFGHVPPVASGGDSVIDEIIDGIEYRIHAFTSTGTSSFSVTRKGLIDYLIVAGGGAGGGGDRVGGGGAGGLLFGSLAIESENYNIIVGNGGLDATTTDSGQGDNGENSSAFGFTAIGGGGGGNSSNGSVTGPPGADGGSGGGAGNGNTYESNIVGESQPIPGGQGTPGQGNYGGNSRYNPDYQGGGGGGFGSRGGDFRGGPLYAGKGGDGGYFGNVFTENFGENGWFAGGGAGRYYNNSNYGEIGGLGGGGDSINSTTTSGQQNTGGGGSGNRDGGSGIVLVRYRISY